MFGASPDVIRPSWTLQAVIALMKEMKYFPKGDPSYAEKYLFLPYAAAVVMEHFHLNEEQLFPCIQLLEHAYEFIGSRDPSQLNQEYVLVFLDTYPVVVWIEDYNDMFGADTAAVALFAIKEVANCLINKKDELRARETPAPWNTMTTNANFTGGYEA